MKYPQQQFKKLVNILSELNKHIDNLENINYSHLHFLAYQQVHSGQTHNRFVLSNGELMRQNFAEKNNLEYSPLFQVDNDFELYPNDTNDNHIETAIKNALNSI